ncbi:MAG: hypothetical protein HYY28_03655 [Betaproteobacteria bacterium]|nr:hypothetical protein [Betaproteobacteria bacterium]MBI2959384.1 hypothetical protein [Betaproteobacteria bacterium]
MNRYQWITIALALGNLVLIGLFPPYDYVPAARAYAPTFDGFYWVLGEQGGRVVNSSFLQLEIFVVCANAAIAWLVLRGRPQPQGGRGIDWQRVVLFGVGLNLVLVLLFPPMQNIVAVTQALLPSFDGFYFVFGEHGRRTIVTPILYLEVIFILVNGALLYLLFSKAKSGELTPEQRAALLEELKRAASRR